MTDYMLCKMSYFIWNMMKIKLNSLLIYSFLNGKFVLHKFRCTKANVNLKNILKLELIKLINTKKSNTTVVLYDELFMFFTEDYSL